MESRIRVEESSATFAFTVFAAFTFRLRAFGVATFFAAFLGLGCVDQQVGAQHRRHDRRDDRQGAAQQRGRADAELIRQSPGARSLVNAV